MSGFLLDTDILSLFAKVDASPLLCQLLGCERLPITIGVFNEIVVPLEYGYDFPQRILALADMVLMTPDEADAFESLRLEGKVSASDAELIAICQRRGMDLRDDGSRSCLLCGRAQCANSGFAGFVEGHLGQGTVEQRGTAGARRADGAGRSYHLPLQRCLVRQHRMSCLHAYGELHGRAFTCLLCFHNSTNQPTTGG